MHKRRRIKYAVEKGHLPLMKKFICAADVSVDVPLTEKVLNVLTDVCPIYA